MTVKLAMNKKARRKIHLFSKPHWDDIRAATLAFKDRFLEAASECTVEENWLEFVNHINSVIEEFVPSKLLSTRHNLPWVDPQAHVSIGICQK